MITFQRYLESMTPDAVASAAQEFYQLTGDKYKGCKLGVAESGNCAWFARDFYNWAAANKKGTVQIVFFMWGEREESAHVVPVLNGQIVDYIQEFSQNQPFKISPIGNPPQDKVLPLEGNLPADISSYYKKWYDEFIFGNSIEHIEQVVQKHIKDKNWKVDTFQQPTNQRPSNLATN